MVGDVAVWAVPFGLVGGRLYHVLTDPELYFGEGKSPITALYVWQGGLGIWGAIALGALGAYIGVPPQRLPLPGRSPTRWRPASLLAQAIGRWGNWFNQELFGKPTDLPWGLEIDPEHRADGYAEYATFHPTFLYESLWDLGVAGLVDLGRPQLQARPRPGLRAVRDGLHRRPGLDRVPPHRHRPTDVFGAPAQRLDVDRRVPARRWRTS